MKDLQKMREDFEKEYKIAELENNIELQHPELQESGIEVNIFSSSDNRMLASFRKENSREHLSDKEIGMLLSLFPADQDIQIGNREEKLSDTHCMETYAHPSNYDAHTYLRIKWICQNVEYWADMRITKNCEIADWFKESSRPLTEIEISTYGIQKNRYTKDFREYFPIIQWANGNVIAYSGGTYVQTTHAVIYGIVEQLKYLYDFSE